MKTSTAHTTWILVADRGRARILSRVGNNGPLKLVESFECPAGSSHVSELVSDQQGRFRGRNGPTATSDKQSDLKRHSAARFASEIAKSLERGRQTTLFKDLELVVAPTFLGAIRSALTSSLQHTVTRAVARDYTALSEHELTKRLATSTKAAPAKEPLFETESLSDTLVISLTDSLGALTFNNVQYEADAIVREFETSYDKRHIVIDFERCDYFGSAGIGFFIRLWTQVRSRGGSMVACNVSALEQELLTLTHLDKLWPILNSREEALEAVRNDICIHAMAD